MQHHSLHAVNHIRSFSDHRIIWTLKSLICLYVL